MNAPYLFYTKLIGSKYVENVGLAETNAVRVICYGDILIFSFIAAIPYH